MWNSLAFITIFITTIHYNKAYATWIVAQVYAVVGYADHTTVTDYTLALTLK